MNELDEEDIYYDVVDFGDRVEFIVEIRKLSKKDFNYNIDKTKYGTIVELIFNNYGIKKLYNFDLSEKDIYEDYNNNVYRLIINKK